MLFASEKQVSPIQTRYFSTKSPTVLNTIWSGQMLHMQLYVDRKLLDYVHHYNWHGPMVFFNKLFSLCLSLSLWRSVFEYCVQVFPCVHTFEDGAQVAHPIIFPDNQVFLFFYCFYIYTHTHIHFAKICKSVKTQIRNTAPQQHLPTCPTPSPLPHTHIYTQPVCMHSTYFKNSCINKYSHRVRVQQFKQHIYSHIHTQAACMHCA